MTLIARGTRWRRVFQSVCELRCSLRLLPLAPSLRSLQNNLQMGTYDLPGGLELHHVSWIIAGIFAFASFWLSVWIIYKHMANYTEPHLQKWIVRLIIMLPVRTALMCTLPRSL